MSKVKSVGKGLTYLGPNYSRIVPQKRVSDVDLRIGEAKKRRREKECQRNYGRILRSNVAAGSGKPVPVKPVVVVVDPVMAELDGILEKIRILTVEAENYTDIHINQDYRRINADFGQFQIELDKLDLKGREDARQKKKKGIQGVDKGAEILSLKIHEYDHTTCNLCLPI